MAGFDFLFPLVCDEFGDELEAALSLLPEEVACSVGYPVGGVQDKHVWVSGTVPATHPFYTSGFETRGEKGRLSVHIVVTKFTEDMVEVRDEAVALARVVEDTLAVDRTLGGLVDQAFVVASDGQEAIPSERQRQYGITLTVEYEGSVAAG